MRYVLIALDKAGEEWPVHGGISGVYPTKVAAVKHGRNVISDTEALEHGGYVISVIDLETLEATVLLDN